MHRTTPLALFVAAGTAVAGPIVPPSGPVGSTYKTLDAIEPRICVNDLPGAPDATHKITSPSNYYLTGNINAAPGTSAVIVDLAADPTDDPFTLDLNGYAIIAPPGSPSALSIESGTERLTVLQGGTVIGGNTSIYLQIAGEMHITNVSVQDSILDGIDVVGGPQSSIFIRECRVRNTGRIGIRSTGSSQKIMSRVDVSNTGSDGILIQDVAHFRLEDFTILNAGGAGLHVTDDQGAIDEVIASKGQIDGIASLDVYLENIDRARLNGLSVTNCGGDGIQVSSFGVAGQSFVLDATHSSDNVIAIQNGIFTGNTGDGIRVSQTNSTSSCWIGVSQTTASNNTGDGVDIDVSQMSGPFKFTVRTGDLSGNGGHGINLATGTGAVDVEIARSTVNRNILKGFFETGDIPTEGQFHNLIDSSFNGNGDVGVSVNGGWTPNSASVTVVARGCSFNGNTGDGFFSSGTVAHEMGHNFAADNGGGGFVVSAQNITISNCTSTGNGGDGAQISAATLTMRDCVFNGNTQSGVDVSPGPSNPVQWDQINCSASGNGAGGFVLAPAAGFTGCMRFSRCTATANVGDGFSLGSGDCGVVEECTAQGNTASGF